MRASPRRLATTPPRLGNGVTVNLTDATRAGIGTFNFPATTQANLLLKLTGSDDPVDGTSAQIIGTTRSADR